MVKIGTYVIKSEELSPIQRVQMIKDAGFDFICVGMHLISEKESARTFLRFCEKKGLPIENAHLTSNGAHAVWREGGEGDQIIERYCREIAVCHEYGIQTGIAHVTWGTTPPPALCELALARFERVARCAERYGFTIAFENSVSAEHLHYVLSALKQPCAGYCFDSGHMNAFAPDADYLTVYGPRLAATHLQDNDGKNDLHLMPLDGCVPWEKVIAGLAGTSYGSQKITAEAGNVVVRERPGESAAQIRRSLERVPIACGNLMDIYDGGFTVYGKLSYAERIARLCAAMRKIADGVEKANKRAEPEESDAPGEGPASHD